MGKGSLHISQEDNEKSPSPEKKTKKKGKQKKIEKNKKSTYTYAPIELIHQELHEERIQQESQPANHQKERKIRVIQKTEKCKIGSLSICFPDSILDIPQNSDLRSYFVSQVARICSIFKVDEIIILQDHGYTSKSEKFNPTQYLVRNLQYLQTPQYLRKYLFKMHPDLQKAGLMNPLQCPHHLKSDEVSEFREGVTLDRPTKKGMGSWVDIGLKKQARLNNLALANLRVTVRLKNYQNQEQTFYQGEAVSKRIPRQQKGLYWGYDVGIASNLQELVQRKKYDMKILCNHLGEVDGLEKITSFDNANLKGLDILIFFSGADDLSALIQKDTKARLSVQEAHTLFDYSYSFPNLGVKKLRIEEQMFMSLTHLSSKVI